MMMRWGCTGRWILRKRRSSLLVPSMSFSALAFGTPFGYLACDEDLFDNIKISTAYIPLMMVLASVL